MARYVMAIDATKCIHCNACVIACQERNQVPVGYSRNWVKQTPNPAANSGFSWQPGACMHCDNPLCVYACPTHATYKAADGAVLIDIDRCIGCGGCIEACPYGARYKNPETGVADKCDYCRAHSSPGQEPACVGICPSRCRTFGDADDPSSPVHKVLAENKHVYVFSPEADTKPTLTYLNETTPTDWPRKVEIPMPLKAMGPVAKVVKYVGALALFGVIGVFFKQLVLPSDREHGHHEEEDNQSGGNAS